MPNPSDTAAARGRLGDFAAEAEKTSQSLTEAYIAPYGPGRRGRVLLAADLRAILTENEELRAALKPFAEFDLNGFDGVMLEVVPSSPDNPSRRIEPIWAGYFRRARAALSNQQGGGE